MAYYTGTATSSAILKTALFNACVAEGWANPATDILSKGDCFVKIESGWRPAQESTRLVEGLSIIAGTGQSGGTLTDPAYYYAGIRADYQDTPENDLSYPLTYHIMINDTPDDVTLAVNYSDTHWQWMGFGTARKITNLQGTGAYSWASSAWAQWGTYNRDYSGFNLAVTTPKAGCNPLFWDYNYDSPYQQTYDDSSGSSFIHLDLELDSVQEGWWSNHKNQGVTVAQAVRPQMNTQPNSWNNEALLIRTQLIAEQDDGFFAYVAEIPHVRWTRNTFLEDGEIITLGSEQWFVAPILEKDLLVPDGSTNGPSGTCAFAVRYTP